MSLVCKSYVVLLWQEAETRAKAQNMPAAQPAEGSQLQWHREQRLCHSLASGQGRGLDAREPSDGPQHALVAGSPAVRRDE